MSHQPSHDVTSSPAELLSVRGCSGNSRVILSCTRPWVLQGQFLLVTERLHSVLCLKVRGLTVNVLWSLLLCALMQVCNRYFWLLFAVSGGGRK